MKWISVKERLPEEDITVYVFTHKSYGGRNLFPMVEFERNSNDELWFACQWEEGPAFEIDEVSHWIYEKDIPRPARIIKDPGAHLIFNRRPTENDSPNIKIGESWYVSTLDEFWVLYDIIDGKSIWYLAQRVKSPCLKPD